MAMRLLIVLVMALLPWEGAGGSGGGGAGGAWSRVWMSRKTQDPLLLAGDAASNRIVLLERGSPRKIREWLVQQNHRNIVRLRGGQQSASLASALSSIGLERYVEVFEKEGIKPRNLESLTAPDLKELGMKETDVETFLAAIRPTKKQRTKPVRGSMQQKKSLETATTAKPSKQENQKKKEEMKSTRFERTLVLLASGSDLRSRLAAAEQIAGLFKAHREVRMKIVQRVMVLCGSRDWDTRAAACKTMELIAAEVEEESLDAAAAGATAGDARAYSPSSHDDTLMFEPLKRLEILEEIKDSSLLFAQPANSIVDATPSNNVKGRKSVKGRLEAEKEKDQRDSTERELGEEMIVQYGGQGEGEEKDLSWVLSDVCKYGRDNLLHPAWEVRHGAALVLKHVLKYHPCSTNKTIAKKEDDDVIRRSFVIECVVQLLRVLALDRFSDYSGDFLISPVRETAAQALSVAAHRLGPAALPPVLSVISALQTWNGDWEVRQSCFLALKYLSISFYSAGMNIRENKVWSMISNGLVDMDDVRSAAIDAVEVLLEAREEEDRGEGIRALGEEEKISKLASLLWQCIEESDELSVSSAPALRILAKLEKSRDITCSKLIDVKRLHGILKFFRHNIAAVRRAVIEIFSMMLRREEKLLMAPSMLQDMMQTIILCALIENHPEFRQSFQELWVQMMTTVKGSDLLTKISLILVPPWLNAISTPPGSFFTPNDICKVKEVLEAFRVFSLSSESSQPVQTKSRSKKRSKQPSNQETNDGCKKFEINTISYQTSCKILATLTLSLESSARAKIEGHVSRMISSKQASKALVGSWLIFEMVWEQLQAQQLESLVISPDVKRSLTMAMEDAETERSTRALAGGCVMILQDMRDWSKQAQDLLSFVFDSLENEEDRILQNRTVDVLVEAAKRKLIRREDTQKICRFIMSDRSFTASPQDCSQVNDTRCVEMMLYEPPDDETAMATMAGEDRRAGVKRRGAVLFLLLSARQLADDLFLKVPGLRDVTVGVLELPAEEVAPYQLVEALQLCSLLLPHAAPEIREEMLSKAFAPVLRSLRSDNAAVRQIGARTLAEMAVTERSRSMEEVVRRVVPMMEEMTSREARLGACEAVHRIICRSGVSLLPFAVFLVAPILGRMSDSSPPVREISTRSFATLLRVLPLEEGVPDPEGVSMELREGRRKERVFLEQLLDPSKIDEFPICVPLGAKLRRYQQEGVNWLGFLLKYQLHGILCDDMGLGKTLQTIAAIACDTHLRRERYKRTGEERDRPLPSLIVCPPTLVDHWQHEILQFCNETLVPITLRSKEVKERASLREELLSSDKVLILSYDSLRLHLLHLLNSSISWNFAVLDEGHIIKNPSSKITAAVKSIGLCSLHRLILTGTPIQNNVLELWSLFDFLMPGFLGSAQHFQLHYARPILESGRDLKVDPQRLRHRSDRERKEEAKVIEAGDRALDRLHRQVLPFMLRRTKEEVLQDLPPKIIQDILLPLTPLQSHLYRLAVRKGGEGGGGAQGEKSKTLQTLTQLKKIVNHPMLVLDAEQEEDKQVIAQVCGPGVSPHDINLSAKLLALHELLVDCGIGVEEEQSSSRVLIFAQMRSMLDIIQRDLLEKKLPAATYLRMDGTTPVHQRFEIQKAFNSDPTIDLLLLTTHVGGLGLTLTGADTVIFIEHDWNPMKDLQAMDRAHRIGQTKTVNVFRLITKGTLEEKIMGLQRFKLNVANTVVSEENSHLETFDTSTLLDLLKTDELDLEDVPQEAHKGQKSIRGMRGLASGAKEEELGWDEHQYEQQFDRKQFAEFVR